MQENYYMDSEGLPSPGATHGFLKGDRYVGRFIEAFDWSATSLGPIARWPEAVKIAVGLMLRSPAPSVMLWGEEGVAMCNAAYARLTGVRLAEFFGATLQAAGSEPIHFHEDSVRQCLGGHTLSRPYKEFVITRNGKRERVRMDVSYTPVADVHGGVLGVYATVAETAVRSGAESSIIIEHKRLCGLFQSAPSFVAMFTGPQHVYAFANAAHVQLVGDRELIGQSIREALPEIEGQGIVEVLDSAFVIGQERTELGRSIRFQRAPGGPVEQRFIDFVSQPVRNEVGNVVGVFVVGSDVTDRVRLLQALEAGEGKFRTSAEQVPNHVWTVTVDGKVDWINHRLSEYAGIPPSEIDLDQLIDFVHPEDQDKTVELWGAAFAAETSFETELRLRRADGIHRWFLVRACPVRNEDGTVQNWIGSGTEIETQKVESLALGHLNAMLEELVLDRTADRDRIWRMSSEMMLVSDFETGIAAVNPTWTEKLGWAEEDLVCRRFLDFVHPDDRDKTMAEVARIREGGVTFSFENRFRRKLDGYSTLSWVAVSVEGSLHAVVRDITKEREAARVLHETELALRHAQKLEMIGKLTGGVAHDFNNILQVISGSLQILAKDVAGEPRPERWVASALAAVKRGAKISGQLLAFGRRQPLVPKTISAGKSASLKDMLRQCLGVGIEVEINVEKGVGNVFVDPAQLENAFLNLAVNARDAMLGQGKLTIVVRNASGCEENENVRAALATGEYVEISVTDTGCGMSEDVLAAASEPFFTTKPEGMGTGLGLSMVYDFAIQSGGHVSLKSEVGRGTTVTLFLPRALRIVDIDAPPSTGDVRGGAETILVAEDDTDVCETVVELLRGLGYRVLVAADSETVIQLVNSGTQIHVLFLDMVLPGGVGGIELVHVARKRLPDLAVLLTSGHPEGEDEATKRRELGLELLEKPYARDVLARSIRHALASR